MIKTFALLVTGSPYGSHAHQSAIRFIEGVYQCGHQIQSVFFYGEAVYAGLFTQLPANDEFNCLKAWCNSATDHQYPLNACISVSNKRGILSSSEQQQSQAMITVQKPFEIVGLGAMAEAVEISDKFLHFS